MPCAQVSRFVELSREAANELMAEIEEELQAPRKSGKGSKAQAASPARSPNKRARCVRATARALPAGC
jgi:hypothetical protein